jgi:hypothetical protein
MIYFSNGHSTPEEHALAAIRSCLGSVQVYSRDILADLQGRDSVGFRPLEPLPHGELWSGQRATTALRLGGVGAFDPG